MVGLKPADALDGEALAALFTAGYEGYWFPITVDAPAFARMIGTTDVDLRLSRVAIDDGEPVAIALVARRDTEGWIGGMGVVAPHRRKGIGEATLVAALDAARAAGIERVRLEVLEQNEPARRLYERLGFERLRVLEVWSGPAGPGEPHEVAAAVAHAWLRAHRAETEPWQRDDASIERLGETRGLMVGGAAALVRLSAGRVGVLQLGGRADALRELLAGARSLAESLSVVNLPAGHPASAVLAELGGRVDARQHEMAVLFRAPAERVRLKSDMRPRCPQSGASA